METPDKIYFTANENGTHYYTEGIPFEQEYDEYTNTDAFIDKAIKFFQSKSKHGMIEENINIFIDEFCKVVKGE